MSAIRSVPEIRCTELNQHAVRHDGDYVLYWMVAQRRLTWNFALQRAIDYCHRLNKPLVIFEPLRVGYRWASARHHQFVIEGMRDHQAYTEQVGVTYFPYVEREEGAGKGLLEALAHRSCVVITDEYPCFFIPRMTKAAAQRSHTRFEQVDSCGILPLRASGRIFTTAASFRRHLHKTLLPFFAEQHFPVPEPLKFDERIKGAVIPQEVLSGWGVAQLEQLLTTQCRELPIDQSVYPVDHGGPVEAQARLNRFIEQRLRRYHSHRNALDGCSASQLSAHIHFGHISTHQLVQSAFESCEWSPEKVAPKPTGSRSGWWGASTAVESFIDELITWRELGFAYTFHNPEGYDQYDHLPSWALKTLADHASDPRPHLYSLEELEQAQTHEPVWNAAQRQLLSEGRIHNYMRMLWGKKILEWSPTPQIALERLIELNNKYALDGRDPNSYSGIFWCLGRFDRAWGPERPIFGKVRFMSAASTMKKLKAASYVRRYTSDDQGRLFG